MIEGRIEIKADNLSQEIVEVLNIERKVDIIQRQMGYDLHCIDTAPDCLHVHLQSSR